MIRSDHCTHPDQAWCDCDWCRVVRARSAWDRQQRTLALWRERYGDLDPADHELAWAAVGLDLYLIDQQEG